MTLHLLTCTGCCLLDIQKYSSVNCTHIATADKDTFGTRSQVWGYKPFCILFKSIKQLTKLERRNCKMHS